MKKIIVPFKDEECIVEEVKEQDLINVESGGLFTCFFLKRCFGVKQMYKDMDKILGRNAHA